MITDFGITDFWLYASLVGVGGIASGALIMPIGVLSSSRVRHAGFCVVIASIVVFAVSGGIVMMNGTERYDGELKAIKNSIDTTGEIPTQSALLCQMSDIDTRQCNLDMFDWYMENHYDPTSNASMRVAMQMRGNVG
ncbi:MAG: hypothetical protein KAJ03_07285 [Gammaproteobacteria bacterium]|nr:hypothetical protein [Gammaproteobacteria bacterium]